MPQAQKKVCDQCNKKYFATRVDSKYCSQKCRTFSRMENAKFEIPEIPQSATTGVSFHRIRKKWVAILKKKYLGSFSTEIEAVKFLHAVKGN